MKLIGIHQPNFLPHLGFFDKIAYVDTFVILDNVQHSKGGYTNRAKIKGKKDPFLVTVPVKNVKGQLISELEFANYSKFKRKFTNTLTQLAPKVKELFKPILDKDHTNLCEFNKELIEVVLIQLGIKTDIVLSSALTAGGKKSELILNIVKELEGDVYISGGKTNKYLDLERFDFEGIGVLFQDFQRNDQYISVIHHLENIL